MVMELPPGLLGTMNNIWQQPLCDLGGPFSPEQNRGGRFLVLPPGYPTKPFEDIDQARQWVAGFSHWYNEIHYHSALKFVTRNQRHQGEDLDILAGRKVLYEAARRLRPERWSGSIRDWEPTQLVYLNPNRSKQESLKAA